MCEITTILHGMPKKHGLSIEWIADHIGVNASTLQRWLNPNDPLPFPAKKMIVFMKACNKDYSALDHIESRVSRVAIDMAGSSKSVTIKKTASRIAEQQGKALSILIEALEDNKLDSEEKKALRKEYFSLATLIHTALQALDE